MVSTGFPDRFQQVPHRHWIIACIALLAFAQCAAPGVPPKSPSTLKTSPSQLAGFWEDKAQPGYFVSFDGQSYILALGGQIRRVARILESSGSRIRLCEDGQDTTREFSWEGDSLLLRDLSTAEVHHFKRLQNKPRDLILLPFRIPDAKPITAERAQQTGGELRRRVSLDQMAQKKHFESLWRVNQGSGEPHGTGEGKPLFEDSDLGLIATKSDNTAFLKKLIGELGWIDSRRFGPMAADDAFLLVQHSEDLPLMLATLPRIKEDVDAGYLQGETYALLYDRLQLLLGKDQLYGTRMGKDDSGKPVVLPTERPEEVDVRRKALNMAPLSQYVKIFGASGINFSSACRRPERPR